MADTATATVKDVMLHVQPDWPEMVRDPDGKAWITLKARGRKGHHCFLLSDGSPQSMTIDNPAGRRQGEEGEGEELRLDLATSYSLVVTAVAADVTFKVVKPDNVFQSIHPKSISTIDVSEGGLGVSAGDGSTSIMVWETKQGVVRRELEGHLGDVYSVRLFPSGVVVLSSSADMRLRIWSAEDGSCPRTLVGHTAPITSTAIVDKGMNVVSGSKDGTLRLWSCGQEKCLEPFVAVEDVINSCDITCFPDLQQLKFPPKLQGGEEAATAEVDTESIDRSDEVGTEDKLVCVGGENGWVCLVNLYQRRVVFRFKPSVIAAVNVVRFSSCGSFLVVGTEDGAVAAYQLSQLVASAVSGSSASSPEPIRKWHDSNSPVLSLLLLSGSHVDGGGGLVVGRGDGSCVFYPVPPTLDKEVTTKTNKRIVLSGADIDPITAIAADSDHVYTACRDGSVRKYATNHLKNF